MLDYAILGLLKNRPLTGYDIDKIINRSIKNFWSILQSQVYKELKKMENNELIVAEVVIQKNKPNKVVYSISEKGERYYETFFDNDKLDIPKLCDIKILFLIRMFFGSHTDKEHNIEFLERLKVSFVEKIASLELIKVNIIDVAPVNNNYLNNHWYWTSTVDCGIQICNSIISWIDSCLKEINKQ